MFWLWALGRWSIRSSPSISSSHRWSLPLSLFYCVCFVPHQFIRYWFRRKTPFQLEFHPPFKVFFLKFAIISECYGELNSLPGTLNGQKFCISSISRAVIRRESVFSHNDHDFLSLSWSFLDTHWICSLFII